MKDYNTTEPVCEWKKGENHDAYGDWHSSCNVEWELNYGSPKDNGMKFCPFCGLPLTEGLNNS